MKNFPTLYCSASSTASFISRLLRGTMETFIGAVPPGVPSVTHNPVPPFTQPLENNFPFGVSLNQELLFPATVSGATGRELWKTDGTPAGTALVRDIRPGTPSSSPNRFSQQA